MQPHVMWRKQSPPPAAWGSVAPLSSERVLISLDKAELAQSCHLKGDLGGDTWGNQTHKLLDSLVFTAGMAGGPCHGERCQQLNPEPARAASLSPSDCRVAKAHMLCFRTSGGEL